MRLLGAGLLWTSLIYAGAAYSTKLKKRVILLEKTIMMLEEMKIIMQYLNSPVYEMLEALSKKDYMKEFDYIHRCCYQLSSGIDFPVAWENAVNSTVLIYKTQEKERLLQIGENLGISNTKTQLDFLNMQTLYFQEYLLKAKAQCKKYGNSSTVLGALLGCMIFILVI